MASEIFAERAWERPGQSPLRRNVRLRIEGTRIAAVEDAGPADAAKGRGRIVVPAPANAHDHGRSIPTVAYGADDGALEVWIPGHVLHPAVPAYHLAAVAYGHLVRAGVTSVVHFFSPQNPPELKREVVEICKAARDVGIRMAMVVGMRDQNRLGYGSEDDVLAGLAPDDRAAVLKTWLGPMPDAERQVALVDELAAECEGGLVTVQYGPAGLQWCSDDMMARIGRGSADHKRRVQAHLLETWYQRVWLDRAYNRAPLQRLDDAGLLGPLTSFAHGVWLRPEEMELLAKRGATVVLNGSSNLRLRSGRAHAAQLDAAGVNIAIGLDSSALDSDDDEWREMRLQRVLHGGTGVGGGLSLAGLANAAFANGHRVAGSSATHGALAPDASADLVVLDWTAIGGDAIDGVTDEAELFLARAGEKHVRDVWVAGRHVVADGKVLGVDLPALEAEMARAMAKDGERLRKLKPLVSRWQAQLHKFYSGWPQPA